MDGKTWAAVITIVFLSALTVYGIVAGKRRQKRIDKRCVGCCVDCPYHCSSDGA